MQRDLPLHLLHGVLADGIRRDDGNTEIRELCPRRRQRRCLRTEHLRASAHVAGAQAKHLARYRPARPHRGEHQQSAVGQRELSQHLAFERVLHSLGLFGS
jgi:hypothetical protein